MISQDKLDDAILSITGHPDWAIIQTALTNEIYQCQATSLDVKTWEEVCALRGYARGLAFVINLRDMTIMAKEQEAQDAAL
jgi:hypothetical protein